MISNRVAASLGFLLYLGTPVNGHAQGAQVGQGTLSRADSALVLRVLTAEDRREARVELALRFVCGVPTARIAGVFLVPEPTMAARLTRAKKRIHDARLRFALDDPVAVAARMPDALTTIYLLYTVGHQTVDAALRRWNAVTRAGKARPGPCR